MMGPAKGGVEGGGDLGWWASSGPLQYFFAFNLVSFQTLMKQMIEYAAYPRLLLHQLIWYTFIWKCNYSTL